MNLNLKFFVILSFLLIGCARSPITKREQSMRPTDAPDVVKDDLNLQDYIVALKTNIRILKKQKNRSLTFGERKISASDYADALQRLVNQYETTQDKRLFLDFLNKNFSWYEVYGRDSWGEIMMTSYYEPIYDGRLKAESDYSQPIYALPKDLIEVDLRGFSNKNVGDFTTKRRVVGARIIQRSPFPRVVPFYSREEIDNKKKLSKRKLELYYLDPIQAFFLQIQGSGVIKLKDGSYVRVGYAGQNGHRYESIGKHLFDIIPKEEMSLQKIEAHLRTLTKKELYDFLTINPSYVFFRKLKEGRGRTTFGTEVVSGRTIAVDASFFPLGSIGYLSFPKPQFDSPESTVPTSFKETSRLIIAQDTGGAIKSPGRADLFWGEGKSALQYAGVMKHEAKLWFLIPKE